MAFRNASIYFNNRYLSKCYISNISNSVCNRKLNQNLNGLVISNIFQSLRFYHVSGKQCFKISTSFFENRTEKSNLPLNKSIPDMPIIEPNKINEVLSNSKVNAINIKDLNVTIENVKANKESLPSKHDKRSKILSLYRVVLNEVIHYYHGFRLFFVEVKMSAGILKNWLKGRTILRKDKNQVIRSIADFFRLFPFSLFIIIPGAEVLIPFYIKYCSFLMPSTFQKISKQVDDTEKILKGKLEKAKYLQNIMEETRASNIYSNEANKTLELFIQLMNEVRETGQIVRTDDIVKFSRLFNDEITLASLDHHQLRALCKLLEIASIGPKLVLISRLKMKVYILKVDDRMIIKEGIDTIPTFELQQLCRERGMRAFGISEDRLRFQLSQWCNLSVEKQVPISLLLLSRIMYLPENLSPEQQLNEVIFTLPPKVSKDVILRSSTNDENVDSEPKFESITEELEHILTEVKEAERIEKETLIDRAHQINIDAHDETTTKEKQLSGESISISDLNQIETVIENLTSSETTDLEGLDKLNEKAASLQEEDQLTERLKSRESTHEETDAKRVLAVNIVSKAAQEKKISVSDLMKALRQLQSISGGEGKWQRILDVLDEDHDGHIEVHHITKVFDILGHDEVQLSAKELSRLIDTIGKEDDIGQETKPLEEFQTKP